MTTTAAIAAVVITVAATSVAASLATGAEIAEVAGQFSVEHVVERHGNAVSGRSSRCG